MDMMINMFGQLPDWINALTGICASATALTILTPSRSDDKILDWILKILNFISGNFGKNTNKDA